ncbi:hypothetical protein MVES1_002847 [Malassezia vespertilionis]|uniref:Ribosome maturation protein SDO1/SBDS N-terminal domain-containing protein n=1 Tax=Malassezia vespertilionis TaxID=2020962 RepID=A0A2N1JA37_9BASI|nr:uncharacterized protein MVES1_002847 [Malassezia vespertilionis]PKI83416.1 hypothetical protein MVES_002693 [Malassezia vespertilionis]WFD07481.1 hypothetical protein MVES1_002847 [Malassezia vespertilionis]
MTNRKVDGNENAKVLYKADPNSSDEFVVLVNPDMYSQWQTDKSIPLADVVSTFQVMRTVHGAQGFDGEASKQQLHSAFGVERADEAIPIILERGHLQNANLTDMTGRHDRDSSKRQQRH